MRRVIKHVAGVINVKEIIIGELILSHGTERKDGFIKGYMTGNDYLICLKINEAIAFIIGGVTKKNAWNGVRLEFVGIVRMRETHTPENTKVVIFRKFMETFVVWGFVLKCGRWKNIEEVSSHMKSFNPIDRGYVSLENKSTDGVIDGAENAFEFFVLLGSVRA